MPLFAKKEKEAKEEKKLKYDIVVSGEEKILRVNYEEENIVPSLEDNGVCMAQAVDMIIESGPVTKIVFVQKRDYEYDFDQTQLIIEIADLFKKLIKRKDFFSYQRMGVPPYCVGHLDPKIAQVKRIITGMLKSDPLGAYVRLKRILRIEKINLDKLIDEKLRPCAESYISILTVIVSELEATRIVTIAQPYLAGYKIGEREIYRRIFEPSIKPDFMFTKLMAKYPVEGKEIDSYSIGESTKITMFRMKNSIETLYHMMPPEFELSEEQYSVLDEARKIMAEHKPTREEFVEPERMRQVFYNVGHDLIEELAERKKISFTQEQIDQLASILVRYTVGFGLIEVLLQDEKVQDITINSPMGKIPIFIVHGDHGDCVSNIIPTTEEAESWASKLRMISGRPLDEANPIMDTELELPGARARIGAIASPLDPTGLAFAFRRHRDKPWTLPLFIKYRYINSMTAGLLSFIIDGNRTMLIAGTRSAGKSSLLGSILVEIMRKYRILTVEDTLELPVSALRDLNYNIQQLKVRSALARGGAEVPADEGIRTSLRLGDSALIIGEVRSKEALALYEAMRVGAMASVVAGTIHGDSPYGVFDRVVNDLGVPRTSFKATDIVAVANQVRSADGLHKFRRVTSLTEVRKEWEEDPMAEGGFVDLVKYDSKKDECLPTADLINGDSDVLKAIAGNVREWAGNWDAVWDNVMLRARIKQAHTDLVTSSGNLELLEAPFVIASNDQFHLISEKVREEVGSLDSERIYFDWEAWIRKEIRKRTKG